MYIRSLRIIAFFGALLVSLVSIEGTAHAQTAGSNVLTFGWMQLRPTTNDSTPYRIQSIGGQTINQTLPNTGVDLDKINYLGFTFEHYFTDQVAVELVGVIPRRGQVRATESLSSFGVIGKSYGISPIALAKYHFGSSSLKFRPYVGMGISYNHFTDGEVVNNQFIQHFGSQSASLSVKDTWSPVFDIGVDYQITQRWSLGLNLIYMPLKADSTITTSPSNTVVKTTATINPLFVYLNIGYHF
ncbi:OmpW family protein [Paraburkholderia metrosideri]|uniref:OmpW family protein n=1 Tax=Paraburkholderia metrosideri TaxID=580937 RepID=A0ABW9DYT2_9BURK